MHLTKSFEEAKDRLGFCILTLIPPIKSKDDKGNDAFLRDAEILLRETSENMTKVDTSIIIKTTVLAGTGTIVCANVALLCRIFAAVQSITEEMHDDHPTPFLYSAAVQLGTKITSKAIHDATYGNSKQKILLLYSVLACLDMIIMRLGKEAHNPNLLWLACQDSWEQVHLERFAAAHHALTLCLQLLDATATGGALLPQTMLYQSSDHKQTHDDENLYAAAKRLKLMPHNTTSHSKPRREASPNNHSVGPPQTSPSN